MKSDHRGFRWLWSAGLCLACLLAWTNRSEASPELRRELNKMAVTVAGWLAEQGEKSIFIGPIAGPPSVYPGPGLKTMLAEELAKQKIRSALKANLGLAGKYRAVIKKDDRPLSVAFSLEVVDDNNKSLKTWTFDIKGNQEIAFLLGLTTHTLPGADAKEINQELNKHRDRSPARIENGKLLVGPYGLEILIDESRRAVKLDDGLPFVPIEKEEVYAIRLSNNADHDAAVWLAIDGISVFAFNEDPEPDGQRRDYHVIVPKGGSTVVWGWYRRKGTLDSFVVTDYARSAAALKNETAKLGMITAQFRACWEKGSRPPTDEMIRGLATGFGPTVTERWDHHPRVLGSHRATITVRYAK